MSVYFARSGAYVKIGYSRDPMDRVTTITRNGTRPTDVPFLADARLIGWVPGDRDREAQLHRDFAVDHAAGEWYYLDDATVRDVIWSDPRGIDIRRMSAVSVFVSLKYPELTRDEIASLGVQVEASDFDTDWGFLGGAA